MGACQRMYERLWSGGGDTGTFDSVKWVNYSLKADSPTDIFRGQNSTYSSLLICGRAGGITEAELAKNRDLVQLRSDVFMNGMRELQGRVSGPAAPLPLVPEIKP